MLRHFVSHRRLKCRFRTTEVSISSTSSSAATAAALAMFYQPLINGGVTADGTRIMKAETKDLVDSSKDDLAEKADAQTARQPLQDDRPADRPPAAQGEVIDPLPRTRDR